LSSQTDARAIETELDADIEVRVEATLDVARNAKYSAKDAESDANTNLVFIQRMVEDAGGSNDD